MIYAWRYPESIHRSGAFSARGKRVGITAAAAGALAGAWLGFHATEGPLAVFTAIFGAVAGANLALLVLDMSRARSTRNQSAARARTADAPSPGLEAAAEVRSP